MLPDKSGQVLANGFVTLSEVEALALRIDTFN
jgi:hypothetical protein